MIYLPHTIETGFTSEQARHRRALVGAICVAVIGAMCTGASLTALAVLVFVSR